MLMNVMKEFTTVILMQNASTIMEALSASVSWGMMVMELLPVSVSNQLSSSEIILEILT